MLYIYDWYVALLCTLKYLYFSRYYKTKGVLPPTWKYESSTASALVS